MVTLDTMTVNDEIYASQTLQLYLEISGTEKQTLIANLTSVQAQVITSVSVDENFTLSVVGDGIVHVCGWLVDDDRGGKYLLCKQEPNSSDSSDSSSDETSSSTSSASSGVSKLTLSLDESFSPVPSSSKRRRVTKAQPKKTKKAPKSKKSKRSKKHKK